MAPLARSHLATRQTLTSSRTHAHDVEASSTEGGRRLARPTSAYTHRTPPVIAYPGTFKRSLRHAGNNKGTTRDQSRISARGTNSEQRSPGAKLDVLSARSLMPLFAGNQMRRILRHVKAAEASHSGSVPYVPSDTDAEVAVAAPMAVEVTRTMTLMLLSLLGLSIANQWARNLFIYMSTIPTVGLTAEAAAFHNLGIALNLNSAQYGLLSGVAFTFLLALGGLVAGRLADVTSRRTLVVTSVVASSAALAAIGLAKSFTGVLIARAALGLSQSLIGPAAYSFIAGTFPAPARAKANAVYGVGIYAGGALASISQVLNLKAGLGWRATHFVVVAFGLAMAAVATQVIKDPVRDDPTHHKVDDKADDKAEPVGVVETALSVLEGVVTSAREVFSVPAMRLLYTAGAVRFMGGFAVMTFMPEFFRRTYPAHAPLYSAANAAIISIGGGASILLSGYITDKWAETDQRALMWVPTVGSIVGAACILGVVFAPTFQVSMASLFLSYLAAECWLGNFTSTMQLLLPPKLIGSATSLFLSVGLLVGSVAPLVLGVVDRQLAGSGLGGERGHLPYLLAVSVIGSYLTCAALYVHVSKHLKHIPGTKAITPDIPTRNPPTNDASWTG